MQGDDGDGVRHAASALRAAREELPAVADDLDDRIRSVVEGSAAAVEQAKLLQTAHEIRLLGTRMTAAREDAFAAVAHVLSGYADEIEALLRPVDGAEQPAVVTIPPMPMPAESVVTTAQETAVVAQHLPDAVAKRRAINQVVAQFPPKLQALARTLLFGQSAHAVQRHGHHLRREQQVARVQWRLDPAGEDSWQLNADGSVLAQRWNGQPHGVGTTSGHYTSPEAVAKPLIALLRAAGRTQAELDRYLDARARGDTIITIFVRPSDTGITADDVVAVRGPGTDTDPGEEMWLRARDGAMAGHGDPPAVRDYDLVTRGHQPGSVIIFAKKPPQSWRLITGYFLDDRANEMSYTEL